MDDKNYQMGSRLGYRRTAAAWSKQNTKNRKTSKNLKNMLHDKIQELETECVLGHLFNLKSGGDETRIIEITEANSNFRQTNHERK